MRLVLAVAVGSALGGAARYVIGVAMQARTTTTFPLATLAVNLIGSFLLGVIAQYGFEHQEMSATWRAFLVAGLCGGFTTFSAFTAETVLLIQRGDARRALLYVTLSLALGLLAVVAGFGVARLIARS